MKNIFLKPILLLILLSHLCYYVKGQNKNNAEIEIFATYISTHGQEPVDYVIYPNFFDDNFINLLKKRTDEKISNREEAVGKLKEIRPILVTD